MSLRSLQSSAPTPPPRATPVLKPKACNACRTRKVKCDKKSPCSNCTLWSLECHFPLPIRSFKRPRKKLVDPNAQQGNDVPTSPQSLDQRVRELETTLQHLTGLIDGHDGALAKIQEFDNSGGLLQNSASSAGKLDIIGSNSGESLYGFRPGTPAAFPYGFGSSRVANTVTLSRRQCPSNSLALQPTPLQPSFNQAQACWHIFMTNIDPLVKVLHKQSAEKILEKAMYNAASLDKGEQAVLFAICLASLSSMTANQVESCFKMSKNAALVIYRSATEHALMEADFLTSDDLNVLQAFVLFLSFRRFPNDADLVWTFTGLARRIGRPSHAKFSPFEVEVRKRLWWQLWYLDQRAAEDHGRDIAPPIETGTTELPLNIHDSDLDPVMSPAFDHSPSWTEISFSLIRYDIANTSSKIEGDFSLRQKETLINECESRIKSMYLCHCSETNTIYWLARHCAYVLIMEMRFKVYGQLPQSPNASPQIQGTRDGLFRAAIEIVDMSKHLERDPEAKKWGWLFSAYLQYLPVAYLLTELCQRQDSELVSRAWNVAERASMQWSDDIGKSKNGKVLIQLMAKAKAQRSQMVGWQTQESFLPTPDLSDSPTYSTMSETTCPETAIRLSDSEPLLVDALEYGSAEQSLFLQDMTAEGSVGNGYDSFTGLYSPLQWSSMEQQLGGFDAISDSLYTQSI
jgi:Fungal specific transcription factor domain/Fungal Zn(2)-Cys(6) binuclear cluster domain